LIGSDYYQLDFSDCGFVNGWAPVDTMNIFHPVFRRATAYGAHAALLATPPDWTSVGNMAWHGLYAQDQIALAQNLKLLAGGRYDSTRNEAGSITLEYANPGSTLNDVQKATARPQKFSPLVGLMYQPASWNLALRQLRKRPGNMENIERHRGRCTGTSIACAGESFL
jgi:iron complex outermembrane receptor protein